MAQGRGPLHVWAATFLLRFLLHLSSPSSPSGMGGGLPGLGTLHRLSCPSVLPSCFLFHPLQSQSYPRSWAGVVTQVCGDFPAPRVNPGENLFPLQCLFKNHLHGENLLDMHSMLFLMLINSFEFADNQHMVAIVTVTPVIANVYSGLRHQTKLSCLCGLSL